MATFPNLPDPGDTHTIAGVTFTWTEYLNNIGFWLKETASLLQTSVGDTRVLYTEGTNVVGSPYLTYDMDAADPLEMVFTVSSTDASSTIFDMVKFIDKDGLASNVLQSNGLWKGFDSVGTPFSELADNNFYARKNGAWQILSTTGNSVTLGTAVPTHPTYGNASGDLFIHTASEQIYTFDGGSTWTKQFGINRELSTDAPGSVVAPYTNGDMWINEATGSLFAAAASSWLAIGGPAALDLKVDRAPATDADSTITGGGGGTNVLTLDSGGDNLLLMTDASSDSVLAIDSLGTAKFYYDTLAEGIVARPDPGALTAGQGMVEINVLKNAVGVLLDGTFALGIQLGADSDTSGTTAHPTGVYLDCTVHNYSNDADRYSLAAQKLLHAETDVDDVVQIFRDGQILIKPDLQMDGSSLGGRDHRGLHVNCVSTPRDGNSRFALIRGTINSDAGLTNSDGKPHYYFAGVQDSTTVFRVEADGGVWQTGGYLTSDVSTKSSIHYQTSASKSTTSATVAYAGLDLIDQLAVASFTSDYDDTNRDRLGLIAQDVVKKIPEAVVTDAESGLKAVDQMALVAAMINAIQELKDRIEVLEA